jgi:HEAT repeat protein
MSEGESQSELSFDEVISALRDESTPFPARYLYRLSGLEGEELGLLTRIWPDLSTPRRLGLLEDMEMLADSNTVMHFDAVNRIALGDVDARIRLTAVRALWPSEHASLVPKLIDLLENDEDQEVRAQAASALGRFVYLGEVGRIPDATWKQTEDKLLRVIDSDENELVQRRALESMGYSSRAEIPDLIEEAYESDDDEWITSALYAMGRSADERWAPLVLERLTDPTVELSREAARSAGELELEEALPTLVDLLHDEDQELRLAAAWSLSQIGGNGVAEALEEALERAEDDDEIDLIENAIENLAFTQEISELNIMDLSPDDLEDMAHPNGDNGDELDDE